MKHFSVNKPMPVLASDISERVENDNLDISHVIMSKNDSTTIGTVYFNNKGSDLVDAYDCQINIITCSGNSDRESLVKLTQELKVWAENAEDDILDIIIEFSVTETGGSSVRASIYT